MSFKIAQIVYFAVVIIAWTLAWFIFPIEWFDKYGAYLVLFSIPAGAMVILAVGTIAFVLFLFVGGFIISVITGENIFK